MFPRTVRVLVCLSVFALVAIICTPAAAQTQLGTVSTPVSLTSCPSLGGQSAAFDPTMACFTANVTCPNTDQIGIVYGVSTPSGQLNGTIVMLSGDGGVYLPDSFEDYIPATDSGGYTGYLGLGYQVIEAVWGILSGAPPTFTPEDWEYTNTDSDGSTLNILNAACRPATFLNWVRNGNSQSTLGKGIWAGGITGQTGTKGMCAHGNSGGAGALGYALAWYNAGAGGTPTWGGGYLDKVEMENGPVFSNIEQGCEVTDGQNNNQTYICSGVTGEGDTEPGCNFNWNGGSPTDYYLEYIDGDESNLVAWTETSTSITTPACASKTPNATTSPSENSGWYSQSIVNTSLSQQPSFSYPNTAMSGWLCQSVSNTPPAENNSAPEGQLFFEQFNVSNPAMFAVNGVVGCPSNEAVEGGSLTWAENPYGGTGNAPAYDAIIKDMTTNTSVSESCVAAAQSRTQ
jgi:hypothetical protein